ncbi:hypothetical protein O3M35_012550 [Rhynocoris fuscipes]|uniref:Uncharacterized protein n=1 Tax=Rhynocoris fuscipes TaxID=488301 RepID=A0AAW1D0Q2_9HEMI
MPIKLLQQSTKAVAQVHSQDIKIVNSVNETDKYGQFELRLHYEPTFLGDLSILLEVNTEETGNYKYPLILKSLPPKPKGPFILAPEQEIKISFKNVFTKKQTFFCACRSPVFLVKVTQFELKPKAVKIIPVKMLPKSKIPAEYKHDHYPVTASVRIVCSDPLYINTQWDFYLKGLLAAPPPSLPADRDPRKPSAIQSSTKVNMKASAFKLPTSK